MEINCNRNTDVENKLRFINLRYDDQLKVLEASIYEHFMRGVNQRRGIENFLATLCVIFRFGPRLKHESECNSYRISQLKSLVCFYEVS